MLHSVGDMKKMGVKTNKIHTDTFPGSIKRIASSSESEEEFVEYTYTTIRHPFNCDTFMGSYKRIIYSYTYYPKYIILSKHSETYFDKETMIKDPVN